MVKLKSSDFLRDTVLFGITALLFLVANFMAFLGDFLLENALNVLLVAIIFLNIAIFGSILKNMRRDIALFIFMAAFDTLLLGRVYVSWIGYYHKYVELLEANGLSELFQALRIVALSQFFVYLAYRLIGPLFHKQESRIQRFGIDATRRNAITPILRQLSEIILFVSSVPFLYVLSKSALNVLRHGYLSSFTDTQDIPGIISRLSMFFVPSFAVFLATMPTKKQLKWPLLIYLFYMLSSLLTGRRTTIVTEALMLIIYFVMRDNLLPKEKRRLNKQTVVVAGVFGVAAMYMLQVVALIRAGYSNKFRGLGETLVSFFDSQGASFRVIIQTINNIHSFDRSQSYLYLFYPFERFVHNNVFTRPMFGLTPIVEVQNAIFVQTTHNFAHVLTYLVDPARYLSGGGFGTSYIAEAFVAYGIFGVIVISMMIGVAFRFFSSMLTRSWVVVVCCLLAIKDFVYIPRGFAFMWVTDTFNITYFCFYAILYFTALLMLHYGNHVRAAKGEKPTYALEAEE